MIMFALWYPRCRRPGLRRMITSNVTLAAGITHGRTTLSYRTDTLRRPGNFSQLWITRCVVGGYYCRRGRRHWTDRYSTMTSNNISAHLTCELHMLYRSHHLTPTGSRCYDPMHPVLKNWMRQKIVSTNLCALDAREYATTSSTAW